MIFSGKVLLASIEIHLSSGFLEVGIHYGKIAFHLERVEKDSYGGFSRLACIKESTKY